MRWLRLTAATGILAAFGGCATVTVKHAVEPIHIKVDIYIRAERELEKFFTFEEQHKKRLSEKPADTTAG